MNDLNFGNLVDLVQEAPSVEDAYMLAYVGEHLKDYSDPKMDDIYNKYYDIIQWSFRARIVLLLMKEHDEPAESRSPLYTEIDDYDRKWHYWFGNIPFGSDVIYSIFKIFCYHRDEVTYRLRLEKELSGYKKDTDNEQHRKTLIEVVSELPPYDDTHSSDDFKKSFDALNDWLEMELESCKNDLLTKIPKDKFSLYALSKIKSMLVEFSGYIPLTHEEWKEMCHSPEAGYYCLAMSCYCDLVFELVFEFSIEKDKNIEAIFDQAWFYLKPDPNEEVKEGEKRVVTINGQQITIAPPPSAKDKKLKEFLDKCTDYINDVYKGNDAFNTERFYNNSIDQWVNLNIQIIDDKLSNEISPDKRTIFLLNMAHDVFADFKRLLPHSYAEYVDYLTCDYWYYYVALRKYSDCIIGMAYKHDITADKYTNTIYDWIKCFYNDAQNDSENKNLLGNQDQDTTKHTDKQKSPRKRRKKNIDSYIIADDKEALKAAMLGLLKGTGGKDAAYYVMGAVYHDYFKRKKPSFPILQEIFDLTNTSQAFHNYYDEVKAKWKDCDIDDEEILNARVIVKQAYEAELAKKNSVK